MSKLSSRAKSSKLKKNVNHINLTGSGKERKKNKEHPRSYRLDSEIINTLKMTLSKVNEASPKKVSESRLIKALILMSREMDEDIIIRALKEVW